MIVGNVCQKIIIIKGGATWFLLLQWCGYARFGTSAQAEEFSVFFFFIFSFFI